MATVSIIVPIYNVEEELRKEAAKAIPMGRMTETSDIVPAMVYLLSDISSMVTATEFKVNGGELI